jgi:exonuclease SbcC
MWNPEKLIIRNFLSHPYSEFVFPKDKLTMIFGKNEDDNENGADSNGSGKSVLIEAISTALTGSTYRDINKDDYVLDGEENGSIDFYLFNSFSKNKLRIFWEFSKGKSAKVKIYENDSKDHLRKITSVNEAKAYILEKIGVSREDLLNFFIINQGNSNSFFTSGDAKQKEIIGRFANYDMVKNVIGKIEDEKEQNELDLSESEFNIQTQESIIESMKELIIEEENSIDDNSKELISELDKSIIVCENKIVLLNAEIPNKKKVEKTLNETLKSKRLEKEQFDEILEEIEELETEQNKLKRKNKTLSLEKSNLESTLDHSVNCPKCDHEFLLKTDKTVDELKDELVEVDNKLKELDKEILENQTIIEDASSTEQALEVIKSDIRTLKRKISTTEENIKSDEREIKRYENKIGFINSEISDLKSIKETSTNIPTYKNKISKAEENISVWELKRKNFTEKIQDNEYWLTHLGKKGFQTYLANKCINTIQNLCNQFLNDMKVNLRIKINGFKVTASGELRDKIEVLIVKDNEVEAKFNRFSGGQKERINLAGILTFHNLINNSLNGKGLNLLCLDESLDYLDEKGQKVCLNILQLFDLTTFVISHNKVENILEDYNKILVKFSNGKSKIHKDD